MKCPYCSSGDTKVVDKRDSSELDVSRRRRECDSCGRRFTTYERVESIDLVVLKSDGRKESFDAEKIKTSIIKAFDKRSVNPEQVESLVNDIENVLKQGDTNDVSSKVIGSLIMDRLKAVDKIAYLRYASVHLMFEDVNSFEHEIEKLRAGKSVKELKPPLMIKKRTGFLVDFSKDDIAESIWKAAESIGGKDKELATHLSDDVVKILSERFPGGSPTVDDVEDAVEEALVKNGHSKTAKAYIIGRYHDKRVRDGKNTFMDVSNIIKTYLDQSDWRVKENSNTDYSFSGLMLHTAGKVIGNYILNEVYSQPIREAHQKGYFHLHNMDSGVVGYCAGWSLKNLLIRGFGNVPNKVDTVPAKHMDVVVGQIVNYIGCLQMEFSGAQAFNSVDTLLAPFVKTDKLDYKTVKQQMQKLCFNLNIPSRWGSQMPFSNLSFDITCPEDMKNEKAVVGGKLQDFTYGDCQNEMDMINTAFLEVMRDGDAKGRIFTFPIPTYNLTKDFPWDSPVADVLFEVTAKYGLPYFQNYIGSNLDPKSIRAMCCRLNLNLKELMNRPGGGFGAGDNTGSIGVVTMNINRLAYLAKGDKRKFFESLQHFMTLAKDSLEIKRKMVEGNLKSGLMPYARVYLGSFKNHFSTIGLCGMNEACVNFFGAGKDITSPEGKAFTIETLMFMREMLKRFQMETGSLYNLEATPAESTSYRLALLDKQYHPEIFTSGGEHPFLTNSTQLPVDYSDDLFEALKHQTDIQPLYTGGTIFHTFLGERMSDSASCKALVKKIATNTKLPYFSITPTFSICPVHGYIRGEHFNCPIAGQDKPVELKAESVAVPVKALKIEGGEEKND